MKKQSHLCRFAPVLILPILASCSTKIVNKPVSDFKAADGIPWVEGKDYDVYVLEGTANTKSGSGANTTSVATDANIRYLGRHTLGDRVNGENIDPDRRKWSTNYQSDLFASGSLGVDLGDNGDLKKVSVTSKSGTARAAETGTIIVEKAAELKKETSE